MEKINILEVGNRIKTIRLNKGLTQTQLAEYIASKTNVKSISKGTVNNWEHGRNLPNKSRIKAIAELGGVSVNFLLNGKMLQLDEYYPGGKRVDSEKLSQFGNEIKTYELMGFQDVKNFYDDFKKGIRNNPKTYAINNSISELFLLNQNIKSSIHGSHEIDKDTDGTPIIDTYANDVISNTISIMADISELIDEPTEKNKTRIIEDVSFRINDIYQKIKESKNL